VIWAAEGAELWYFGFQLMNLLVPFDLVSLSFESTQLGVYP